MREQVELLEHHARLAADLLDVAEVAGELGAVDHDAPRVVLLEPVDAADHRRLPGTGRADDDDDLLAGDLQVDGLQRGEVAEPFRDTDELDHRLALDLRRVGEHGSGVAHLVPTPSRRSSRWLSRLIVMHPIQNSSMRNAIDSANSCCPRNSP